MRLIRAFQSPQNIAPIINIHDCLMPLGTPLVNYPLMVYLTEVRRPLILNAAQKYFQTRLLIGHLKKRWCYVSS